ncbi:MAG: S41 family peptidase [Anaerolineae bacterium]|nr:S41 family peptidase [Caldilineales bacterium]MDW8268056.1 S41 family peptidase [Anaerolineae bacterium]
MSSSTARWFYFTAGVVTACLVFALGLGVRWAYERLANEETPAAATAPDLNTLYNEAWSLIVRDYPGDLPSERERVYGALQGSIARIGDPYTYFVEPEPAAREQEQLEGRFGGIGAYLELDAQGRVRLRPMVGRPAAEAGLREGDVLLAVDGKTIPQPADLDQVTALLRGPVGTVVRVTVWRDGQRLDYEVTRTEIELPSVSWRRLDEAPACGYIRMERFSALTEREFLQALAELRSQDAGDCLVLDLRGNPGGLLDAAIAIADHFLEEGTILSERRGDGSEHVYTARPGGEATSATVAVLVDQSTASAAEILAGALQDHGRGRLVGAKTYGKGSIQRVHRLSDNSAVHVTFARWFTPNGRPIDGRGLEPDLAVAPMPDTDAALTAALDLLQPSSRSSLAP